MIFDIVGQSIDRVKRKRERERKREGIAGILSAVLSTTSGGKVNAGKCGGGGRERKNGRPLGNFSSLVLLVRVSLRIGKREEESILAARAEKLVYKF